MPSQDMGQLTFTRDERERLAAACQILGITFAEFVKWATLHELDQIEGLNAEVARRRKAKAWTRT